MKNEHFSSNSGDDHQRENNISWPWWVERWLKSDSRFQISIEIQNFPSKISVSDFSWKSQATMVISENNHCVHKPDPGVKKVALGCQRCPTFHRSCFIGHCTLSAPFTTYLLSLNVNATPPLLVDTNNKGHSVALCPSHCCVIWPAGGSTQPRSDV